MTDKLTNMTKRRAADKATQTTTKAAGLTVQQARELLTREDVPVRLAVGAGGLLAFAGVTK